MEYMWIDRVGVQQLRDQDERFEWERKKRLQWWRSWPAKKEFEKNYPEWHDHDDHLQVNREKDKIYLEREDDPWLLKPTKGARPMRRCRCKRVEQVLSN